MSHTFLGVEDTTQSREHPLTVKRKNFQVNKYAISMCNSHRSTYRHLETSWKEDDWKKEVENDSM